MIGNWWLVADSAGGTVLYLLVQLHGEVVGDLPAHRHYDSAALFYFVYVQHALQSELLEVQSALHHITSHFISHGV
jgi:hypothetical protein